jgi:hypothetical protein
LIQQLTSFDRLTAADVHALPQRLTVRGWAVVETRCRSWS